MLILKFNNLISPLTGSVATNAVLLLRNVILSVATRDGKCPCKFSWYQSRHIKWKFIFFRVITIMIYVLVRKLRVWRSRHANTNAPPSFIHLYIFQQILNPGPYFDAATYVVLSSIISLLNVLLNSASSTFMVYTSRISYTDHLFFSPSSVTLIYTKRPIF